MHKVFEKSSIMPGTAAQMLEFHSALRAFQTLTPPPIFIQVLRDDRKSVREGEIEFRMWLGLIPLRWLANHENGSIPTSFVDRMIAGPMAYWEHQHVFQDVSEGVKLTDHITYEHKSGLFGLFTRLFFDGLPLQILFLYRHWVTRRAMAAAKP